MMNLPFLSRLLLTKSFTLMPPNPKISSQFPWIPTGPRGNCWLLSMAPRVFQICAPAAGPSAHVGADGRRYHRGMDFGKDRTAEPWIWAILGPSPHHEKHECYIYSDLVLLYTYINNNYYNYNNDNSNNNNENNIFMIII